MSDTQWPRYEVFKQDTPDKPHQAVGSVHAPDPEMALLNARDVFVRRPRCHSLWVAPAAAILSRTAQELAADPDWDQAEAPGDQPAQTYLVFRKTSQRRAMTFVEHVGDVQAATPLQALRQAVALFTDEPAFVWWIVPATAIHHSDDHDVDSLFAPALDKTYRHQSAYGLVGPQRRGRRQAPDAEAADE
ncbi:MAG: phenylacetic acid degradation protein [Candidatus Promineifilaceae bacterium]